MLQITQLWFSRCTPKLIWPNGYGNQRALRQPAICWLTPFKERQREGIALAKQRGVYTGRKKALLTERIEELRTRVANGEKKAKLAREFGISRETLYQYLRQSTQRKTGTRRNGKGDK
jgi:hypothetical protein